MKKSKSVAGMMALIGGFMGLHRFYLGQVGLGIAYIVLLSLLAWVGAWFFMLINIVDAVSLFSMDQDLFDEKFNEGKQQFDRRDERRDYQEKTQRRERRNDRYAERSRQEAPPKRQRVNVNGFLKSGKAKFKDYDYEGAIEDFTKVIQGDSQNIPAHFNLACAYSLMENKDKSLYHLDRAVAFGFDDFDTIKNRDHLAYLRIQPEFQQFVANGYRLDRQTRTAQTQQKQAATSPPPSPGQGDLLEQLNQLAKLKEKGLLTEEEFRVQKEKLLR